MPTVTWSSATLGLSKYFEAADPNNLILKPKAEHVQYIITMYSQQARLRARMIWVWLRDPVVQVGFRGLQKKFPSNKIINKQRTFL